MDNFYQKLLLIAGTAALVIVGGWCGFKIHSLSMQHADLKKKYSLVNNITNGLLSVDVWREHFITVMNNRIDEFQLSPGQADTLKQEIETLLHSVINKADTLLEKKQKTLGGKIKKFIANMLIDEEEIHAQVPEFSQTILNELRSPENKKNLKQLVKSKLREFGTSTYDSTGNQQEIEKILAEYNASSVDDFNAKSEALAAQLKSRTFTLTYITIGIILIFLLLWWLLRNHDSLHTPFFIISVILALEVLLVGLTTPMIEIDARINELDFHLIGTTLSFDNQVIFFQSKSIVGVVHVLLKTGKYDSILVGILILIFSIVFPISKLLSTGIFLLGNEKWRSNKLVKFFAFKSGKWSMADVNVIAIFMAYIGFKGILDDQLSNLNVETESLTSISTNQTSLQPGYIIFVGFVLYGLVLSMILSRITTAKKSSP